MEKMEHFILNEDSDMENYLYAENDEVDDGLITTALITVVVKDDKGSRKGEGLYSNVKHTTEVAKTAMIVIKDYRSMKFRGTIRTDGISVSILKQNFKSSLQHGLDLNKGVHETVYIDTLTEEELKETENKCGFIDSGRRDLIYCLKEARQR
jgi:hypothetical protein